MSADPTCILAEITDMLHSISDSILPGETITMETTFIEDLGLESISLAHLSGQMQGRYGPVAGLLTFLAGRDSGPIEKITVGELVEYISAGLDQADARTATAADSDQAARRAAAAELTAAVLFDEPSQDEPDGTDSGDSGLLDLVSGPHGHRARNDNVAVLAEHAPGAARRLLQLPSGQVEVFMAGDGPALILMHPLSVGAGVFARQFASLADRYQLICMHNPGVGATTWDSEVTPGGLARLYRTVLTELSVPPPFHVMGSSFGGIVAQEFALLHPAECASLVLVGCSYRVGARTKIRAMPVAVRDEFDRMESSGGNQAAGNGQPAEGDRAELEELLLRCESMDTRMGLRYLETTAMQPTTLLARLPKIAAPTLVLRGGQDIRIAAKETYVLYGAIPDAQRAEIDAAGHFPYLTHPAEFHELVTPFLAAHPGAPRPASDAAAGRYRSAGFGTAVARGLSVTDRSASAAEVPAIPPPPPDRCSTIISTGRCGSTLLSELIAAEPDTLSVFESLTFIRGRLLFQPDLAITGAEYWALLSKPGKGGAYVLKAGVVPEEFSYPRTGRWISDKAAIPPILRITLPRISADPDHLFDLLTEKVPQFPPQPVGAHHKMLMNLLAALMGKRRWVERTGGSSGIARAWLAACPDAKVVYLTRNLADTALSMSRHPVFQMSAIRHEFHVRYGADPYNSALASKLPPSDELPEDMRRLMPDRLSPQTFRELDFGAGVYEAMVAHMNGSADQALTSVQPQNLHRMRYEDLRADPVSQLTRLGEFLEFADPSEWAARVGTQVRVSSRARSAQPA